MKISIETLNNGIFEKMGLWKELYVPTENEKNEAISKVEEVKGYTNPKGVTFVLAKIESEELLLAVKDGRVERRFKDDAITKFKTQLNHPSFTIEKIELF